MNGIINVLKPAGMTSFDVVGFLRKVAGQKKIGHTGTLDPSAVGVLPICLGNATRAIEFIIDKDKVYRAELTLGWATDTQDSSGNIIYSREVEAGNDRIEEVIMSFVGDIDQLPPMYSAIKIDGKKLYDIARQGGTVERQPRRIRIFDIKIIRIWEEPGPEKRMVKKALFDVHCSKGTYIRTLCHDMGEKLGCGGHMSFLVRTRAGKYSLDTALTLEEIRELAAGGRLENRLIPAETVFEDLESIRLGSKDTFKYCNGVWLQLNNENFDTKPFIRVYDNNENFLGIGELFHNGQGTCLKSKKFFSI
ncbi:tRNA pseudouridine(55) synthase TruB [Ruminiclostridium cellobioparum]|uniref:tRNA pseudouridine(55) synthase TruB n=1 Tax=Ruminiclostridium cellobioparum TaxID=29355 RepID=UPI0028A8FFF8|nr:tRNA pseudouridine(55) synthase TruB [Ruminiclostridium cellobioparum]